MVSPHKYSSDWIARLCKVIGYTVESYQRAAFLVLEEIKFKQREAVSKAETYRRDNEELKHHALAKDNFVAALSRAIARWLSRHG